MRNSWNWITEQRQRKKALREEKRKIETEKIAHQVYHARLLQGAPGNAETDWHTAEKIAKSPWRWLLFKANIYTNSADREFALDTLKAGISALGLAATLFAAMGLLLNYQKAQEEKHLAEERLVKERFSEALGQLERNEQTIRLGGIYTLENIAQVSRRDYWTIMEILTTYIRNRSPLPKAKEEPTSISVDVQAALTAITRRTDTNDPEGRVLNLNSTNLRGAVFTSPLGTASNLKALQLRGSILKGAILVHVNLQGADLSGADLRDAEAFGANLSGAKLTGANLKSARLFYSDFSYADLKGANLEGADVRASNFRYASNLTPEQIRLSCWDYGEAPVAAFDKGFVDKVISVHLTEKEFNEHCGKWPHD